MQAPPDAWTACDDLAEAAVDRLDRRHRRRDDAGVADHVGVREVDDPEARLVLSPRAHERRGGLGGAHLRACGRTSARRAGEATSSRRSPVYGVSSPPLKKYVTCGYFSVSATCSCVAPRSASTCESVTFGPLGRERDRVRPVLVVLGHAGVALDRRRAAAVDLAERRIRERERDLAHAVGAEVERDHAVARSDARLVADRRGRDELVRLAALVGGAHGARRRRARCAARGRGRAGRTPAGRGPSACRGPSRSSGRRRCRRAPDVRRRRRPRASPRPSPGSRPRPSAACRGRR